MSSKEQHFPITSFGRSSGRTPAREALSERESPLHHPLLSPAAPSLPTTTTTTANGAAAAGYVPYTPRQRPHAAPTAPSVAPLVNPPTQSKPSATGWRAGAESLGLNADTVGWAILQRLIEADNSGAEWDEIWTALESNKTTLLLPADAASPQDVIGPEFLKDHIAYCTSLPAEAGALVTLSGLRAAWTQDALVFRGSIPSTSKRLSGLTAGTLLLWDLPPLPKATDTDPAHNTLLAHEAKFALSTGADGRPPLPPRPSGRSAMSSLGPSTGSKLSNPFASLFARPSTPSLEASLANDTHRDALSPVSALSISRRIVRRDVLKSITSAKTATIKSALSDLPADLVDQVLTFAAPLMPTHKVKSLQSSRGNIGAFQALYTSIEDQLGQGLNEGEVRAAVNSVETVLCTQFYDQLFRPVESDDASHDEALSGHVAALNMLDLSLDHLGVDAGSGAQEAQVGKVVEKCGEVLQQLSRPDCQTASQKSAILVDCHRTIVDGLGRLQQPVKLKPESETPPVPSARAEPGGEQELTTPSETLSRASEKAEREAAELAAKSIHAEPRAPPPLPPRPHTPPRIMSSPSPVPSIQLAPDSVTPLEPTPVASDVLLPFIIFAVVKANPAQLVSHLLFVQRFRRIHGEEAFCLVNIMAAVEFLENVDLAALGLGEGKVISVSDLTPIPLPLGDSQTSPSAPASAAYERDDGCRRHVVRRAARAAPHDEPRRSQYYDRRKAQTPDRALADEAPWNVERAGFGLLRRASGFGIGIASLPAAVFPRAASRAGVVPDAEAGRPLIEVPPSRASSLRGYEGEGDGGSEESGGSSDGEGEEEDDRSREGGERDARSVRSFSSMLSTGDRDRVRLNISDRLAKATGSKGAGDGTISASASPAARAATLPIITLPSDNSVAMLSPSVRIAPPNARFMTVRDAGDLKLSEVDHLLREYRRVVEGLRVVGGFRDS
ncbi:hypothetical protein BKA62DRAFT_834482 [Auriculariales sp. MPI-PUGE-AT-0066]|nr:hypothetical protein BKA62DRAFT_834482 [Auriculariales sp. MPI-PUGE-AT-0066]